MPKMATKAADNVFYKARIAAASWNDRLGSREGASEVTGIDRTRLANIELGTINPHPEEVLMLSDTYNAPELQNHFCSHLCPLGIGTISPIELEELERVTLQLISAMKSLPEVKDGIIDIAADGVIDAKEKPRMETFLGIPLNQKRTLEARRKLVALYFIGGNHIGSQEIKDIVFGYTGASSSVEFKNSRIYVKLFPNDNSTFLSSDVMECLKRKIPAHLSLSLVLAYIPDLQPAYVAAAPCGMAAFCTVRLPGSIKPRAVTARGYVAGAMSAARMQTTVELPGAIHPKNITAQAYATGGLAHTHETVTIKIGGQTT